MQNTEFNQFPFTLQCQKMTDFSDVINNNPLNGLEKIDVQQLQLRKPPSTHVPSFEPADQLFLNQISSGSLFDRLFDVPVTVTVNDVEMSPVTRILSFEQAGMTSELLVNVLKAGYTQPTPIQQYGIPLVNDGFDMLACAQTGSGKTAAYLLPILTKVLRQEDVSTSMSAVQSPRALIIAPTRELAIQIYNEGRKFAQGTIANIGILYGGTSVEHQHGLLHVGCTVLVATLGRLHQFVNENKISLSKVRFLVLDEADLLLDLGFEPEIRRLIERSEMPTKEHRQTLMFSATFPMNVQELARNYMRDTYALVAIDQIGSANKCITQEFVEVHNNKKKDKLLELLKIDLDGYRVIGGAFMLVNYINNMPFR